MNVNFALSLSFEGISLLRQTASGWVRVADVALSAPDLDSAMAQLRQRARDLDPHGTRVLLVLPNEQIRYLDLPDPGTDATTRRTAARASLDGATPYAVDDLAFDHRAAQGRLLVAAVARETLDEAEEFATTHGFEPAGFTAIAPQGAFDGPLWFGRARTWGKRKLTPPAEALRIVAADAGAPDPVPPTQATGAAAKSEPEQEPEHAALPEPEPEPEHSALLEPLSERTALPEPVSERTALPEPGQQPSPPDLPPSQNGDTASPPAAGQHSGTPSPQEPLADRTGAEPAIPLGAAADDRAGDPAQQTETPRPDQARPAPEAPPEQAADTAGSKPAPAQSATAAPDAAAPPANAPPLSAARAALQANAAQAVPAFSSRREDASTGGATGAARDPAARRLAAARGPVGSGGPIKPRFTPVAPLPAMRMRDAKVTDGAIEDAPSSGQGKSLASSAAGLAARFLSRRTTQPEKPPATEVGPGAAEKGNVTLPGPRPGAPTDSPAAAPPRAPVAGRAEPSVAPGPALPARPDSVAPEKSTPPLTSFAKQGAPRDADQTQTVAAAAQPASQPPESGDSKQQQTSAPAKDSRARQQLAVLPPRHKPQPAAPEPEAALAGPVAAPSTTSEAERERMTVFGARNRRPVRGKPRFLGLMLTILLLLGLVGVAAWATVFLDTGLARLFRPDTEETVVASVPVVNEPAAAPAPQPRPQTPALEDSPAAQSTIAAPLPETPTLPDSAAQPDADEGGDEVQLAALEPGTGDVDAAAPPALAQPAALPARALTPEEAAATYAATGIWQRSPLSSRTPSPDGVSDIYVASIDPSVQQFDAVALPTARSVAPESGLADPGLPPPAGMVFDFDRRGLVRATPEGALSPEGLRIYTGRPPVIPPLREAALTPSSRPATDAADPEAQAAEASPLSRLRPELRPDDLLELRERATLGGVSLQELARIRPALRPRTAQEEAQTAEPESPATDRAVGRSLVPVTRPRNMQAIVRRAEQQRPEAPVQAAAVAPRMVQPSGPTGSSVARAATVRNAINLSRLSLIGVYGTPSKRRALVRLPNGSYVKVKSGDRLDGGRVTAIGESDLRYDKGGRTVTLKMPRG